MSNKKIKKETKTNKKKETKKKKKKKINNKKDYIKYYNIIHVSHGQFTRFY